MTESFSGASKFSLMSLSCDLDVLVTPIRVAPRLKDLTAAERADLISVVKRVQSVIEIEFEADSSTVNIQVKIRSSFIR